MHLLLVNVNIRFFTHVKKNCQEMQVIRCIPNLGHVKRPIKCPIKSKYKPLFLTKVLRLLFRLGLRLLFLSVYKMYS